MPFLGERGGGKCLELKMLRDKKKRKHWTGQRKRSAQTIEAGKRIKKRSEPSPQEKGTRPSLCSVGRRRWREEGVEGPAVERHVR